MSIRQAAVNSDKPRDLSERTKRFALRVIKLFSSLPKTPVAQVIGKQLLRSGTSVGAQYREGKRARSVAEFVSKLECAAQELDETIYWFDLLVDAEIVSEHPLSALRAEASEIMAMTVASVRTAKRRKPRK